MKSRIVTNHASSMQFRAQTRESMAQPNYKRGGSGQAVPVAEVEWSRRADKSAMGIVPV